MKNLIFLLIVVAWGMCGVEISAQIATESSSGHEYVDLGLPSGTLWATCNVGANKPRDNGTYFAWGASSKDSYNLNSGEQLKCKNDKGDDIDCSDISGGNHDAAYVEWGEEWRTPSQTQMQELINNCKWTWDFSGYTITGRTGNSIFLPAAGYMGHGVIWYEDKIGYYNTCTSIQFFEDSKAYILHFDQYEKYLKKHDVFVSCKEGLSGFSVRPVTNKTLLELTNKSKAKVAIKNENMTCLYDSLTNIKYEKDNISMCQLVGQSLIYLGKEDFEKSTYVIESSEQISNAYKIILKNELSGERKNIVIDGSNKIKEMNASWIVEGHLRKLKQKFVGKSYYYIDNSRDYKKSHAFFNEFTNEELYTRDKYWKCIDVTTHSRILRYPSESGSSITFVFEDSNGTKGYCYYEDDYGNYYESESNGKYSKYLCGKFVTIEEKERLDKADELAWDAKMKDLRKKYGKYADQISVGQIDIGMTKEMCREAMGKPTTINTTRTAYGTQEQWVYESKYDYKTTYIYFENGKITAIQD